MKLTNRAKRMPNVGSIPGVEGSRSSIAHCEPSHNHIDATYDKITTKKTTRAIHATGRLSNQSPIVSTVKPASKSYRSLVAEH
jgi:hypothetical protein